VDEEQIRILKQDNLRLRAQIVRLQQIETVKLRLMRQSSLRDLKHRIEFELERRRRVGGGIDNE